MGVVDAVGVAAFQGAEVDVAGDGRLRDGGARAVRRVQLVDLGGDAVDRVRVDVAVVERQVEARAVRPEHRRVQEVGPDERVRRRVETALQVPGEHGGVGEVAGVLAAQAYGVRLEGEPPHLVADPAEAAAQGLVALGPGPQCPLQRVEVDGAGKVEGGARPGRYEQAVLAHRTRRPYVRLLDVGRRTGVLRKGCGGFDGLRVQRPLHEPSGTDLAMLDVGHAQGALRSRHRVVTSAQRVIDPRGCGPGPASVSARIGGGGAHGRGTEPVAGGAGGGRGRRVGGCRGGRRRRGGAARAGGSRRGVRGGTAAGAGRARAVARGAGAARALQQGLSQQDRERGQAAHRRSRPTL